VSPEKRPTGRVLDRGRWKHKEKQLSQASCPISPARVLRISSGDVSEWCHQRNGLPMPEPFDPYYTWLGIPPSEQPADYYRLLGVKQFEENREVISNAADQRMAHVRSFQNGPAARDSQRVLNDLSKAAGCLLNPRRKAMYDQHLQSSSVKVATEEAMLPPQGGAITVDTHSASKQSRVKPPSRRPSVSRSTTLLMATVGAVILTVIGLAIAWKSTRPSQTTQSGSNSSTPLIIAPESVAAASIETNRTLANNTPDSKQQPDTVEKSPKPPVTSSEVKKKAPSVVATTKTSPTTNPTPAAVTPVAVASQTPVPNASGTDTSDPPQRDIPKGKPKALHFEGSDRVELAKSQGILDIRQPFTVEVWIRFAPENNSHWIAGDLIMGGNHPEVPAGIVSGWQLFVQHTQHGRHRIAFSTQEGYASDFPAVANAWHHIAGSSDTRRVTVHVDGRRSASGELSTLLSSFVPSPIPIHIGAHGYLHANQPLGFKGDLRSLRISSVCRYTANFEPSPMWVTDANTQVLLDFPGSTGNTITDISGHGRDGKIQGARWIEIADPIATAVATTTTPKPAPGTPTPDSAAPIVETVRPVPDEVALLKAREQVRKVFEADFKQAKAPNEQLALADTLMRLAAESNDDQPSRFAMYDEAHKLATQAGDLAKSLSIIDDFARRFEIDAPKLKAAAVAKSADSVKTTADRRRLAETAIGLLEELASVGKFDAAADVAQTAVVAATRAKDTELTKVAREYRDEISQAKKHWNEAREAEAKLKDAPNDPALNLRWGRFVCFHQRNWSHGLPYLAKGNDARLAESAKKDLENVTKADEQAAVGQSWADQLKSVELAERTAVALRALHWLRQAESQLKGLAKADVEKQVKELEAALPARFRVAAKSSKPTGPSFQPPPEFLGMPGRIQVNGSDVGVLWKYEGGLRLGNGNVVGVLAQANIPRGKLRMEFVGFVYCPESMTVNIVHNGGSPTATASLQVDNKLVGEIGGVRATSDVYKVELNAGEHAVRWVLQGDDLGTNSLVFTNAATAQPLVLYHNQPLLNLIRDTPTRARLNVNMNRNP
jgi:hypothetical protein